MLLKLFLIILIIYFGWKTIKDFLNPSQKKTEVKGSARKSKPLDFSNYDIEDADFEEIDE